MRCCGTSRCETDRCADSRAPRPDQCRGRKSPLLKVWSGVLVVRCAVIWITRRGTHRVSAGAIARVPAADALALANAGHQLTAAHGGPGRANSVASGRVQGPGPRPAARLAVGVASGSIAASATAALRVLRFVIVAPFLWFNAMPPSLIPPRPVSSARPKPPDAGRVSRNFGPASRQTSEIPSHLLDG